MRRELSKLKGTSYEDTFDWSVYDKISNKFEEQPRGSVVFNTTFKLMNHHSSCSKCHYSFEIDTYGRGCFHNCVYCYAKDQLTKHGYWNKPQPFPVNLSEVRKVFYTVFETTKPSKWRSIMEQRIPLRIGSMSDSFMWMDTRYHVTLELLKILNHYKYPYIIFTRSDLVAHDTYMEQIDKDLASIQFSISGNNQSLIKKLEPAAPSYKRRLKALEKLAKNDFWTTVRINPLFPRFPDGYFSSPNEIIERFGGRKNVPMLNLYNDSFIGELADAGVPSVLAGFVRLSPIAVSNMSKALEVDLKSMYKKSFWLEKGDKRYSDREISYYYAWIKNECKKHGVRFNTCYIGNGLKDYFQYQNLWDNESGDCCDARGNVRGFKSGCQDIPWPRRIKAAACKAEALKAQQVEESFDVQNLRAFTPSIPELSSDGEG
jgi:DNA repair photolyase